MTRTRRSIPGMRQIIVYIPTPIYKKIDEARKELSCSVNEFILEAISDALDNRTTEHHREYIQKIGSELAESISEYLANEDQSMPS